MLVVGDEIGVKRLAASVASRTKLEVDVAEDGPIACHLARKAKTVGLPYDLILVDMQSGSPYGVEAAQWLRHDGWKGPIVALVETSDPNACESFLAAGCDDLIVKPPTNDNLQEALQRLESQYEGLANLLSRTKAPTMADNRKHGITGRVLVAEDAHCSQMIVAAILEKMNLEVDLADNGRIACDMAIQSQAAGTPYDLIFMDMQMPKMNGKQATEWLRGNGWQNAIIALSAHSSDKDHEEFLETGCDDSLAKPVSEASLKNIILQYLKR
jgi:two-component system, sensor histidine kinase and response regulator